MSAHDSPPSAARQGIDHQRSGAIDASATRCRCIRSLWATDVPSQRVPRVDFWCRMLSRTREMTSTVLVRTLAGASLLLAFGFASAPARQQPVPERSRAAAIPVDLDEVTIGDLQQRMESGRETARSLVQK